MPCAAGLRGFVLVRRSERRAPRSCERRRRQTLASSKGSRLRHHNNLADVPTGEKLRIELVSMWVSPAQRRAGIAAELVEAVVGWAHATDAASVDLWVTRGNDAAVRLYEAAGFRKTGEHQPLPSNPCKDELRVRRALG